MTDIKTATRRDHLLPYISHAMIPGMSYPDSGDSGLRVIILRYADRIVVPVSYTDDLTGLTLLSPMDHSGTSLASVPIELVTQFYDEDEAESIEQCVAADQQLLSYAR